MRMIDTIVLHCSATNSVHYDFRAIKRDHMMNRGWKDIGYHFGIDYQANIHILRPIDRPGAHVKGHNFSSIGICLLGHKIFTTDQYKRTAELCAMLIKTLKLDESNILGHNFLDNSKTCPTFDVNWWKENYLKKEMEWNF